jgi:hypothetical protein
MSFNIALSKDEFNQINESSKEEHYECNKEMKVRNYKCSGTWINCMVAKINEIEKTDYKMLGKLNILYLF